MQSLINYFKVRWGISSTRKAVKIFLVFPVTGFSTLFIHKQIDKFLGTDSDSYFFQKILVFLFIVLPVFNILLFFYGTILGEKDFFKLFIKKKYRLITGIFKRSDF